MIFEVKISLFLIVGMLRILSAWSGEPLQMNLLSPFSVQTPALGLLVRDGGPGRVRLSWLQIVGVSWYWE